jgi:hypothetical protein
MIDPGTGLTILGGAIGGSKVVEKILGPTSEYIGDQIKEWTKKRVENTSKIFKNAEQKLGDKIFENGKVSPKVLKGILEDGAWCEEELQVEYFGGVLASSRTGVSRDDRGAYFVSLIGRLTTYQLRTHYLLYHLLKKHFNGQKINMDDGNNWSDLEVFLPLETFYNAMDFTDKESENWSNLLSHSIWGLDKENLLTGFSWGDKEHIQKKFKQANSNGILFQPTKSGVELFMWAYGHGQEQVNVFFSENMVFNNNQQIIIGESLSTGEKKKEL